MFNVFLSRREYDLILSRDAMLLVRAFEEARSTSWCLAGVELYCLTEETAALICATTLENEHGHN